MRKTCPAIASLVAAVFFVACQDPFGLREPPDSCADRGGTTHAQSSIPSTRWRLLDGPHRVTGVASVSGELVIDPGTLVCLAPDARLEVLANGTLTAIGEAATPIIFTATNPAERWGGILVRGKGEATLTHARLEYATTGIAVETAGRLVLERSTIRQIEGSALKTQWAAYASLVEVAIDSACSSACTAAISSDGFLRFQDSRILASGAIGLYGSPYSDVVLDGGSIEGSKGIGLVKSNYPSGSRTLGRTITAVRAIRITGGASYPARVPLQFASSLLPTREAQDGWRGNAKDTAVWFSEWYGQVNKLTIYPGLVWATSNGYGNVSVGELELAPGAAWTFGGWISVARLVSRGTAESPAIITGGGSPFDRLIVTGGESVESSQIMHTRMNRARLEVNHPVVLDHVISEAGSVRLSGSGSRASRAVFRGSYGTYPGPIPLTIAAPDVMMTQCEVTGSADVGVRVEVARDVRFNDCNLHGNTGVAIDNRAADAVDARNNWWGDPAGPNGPNGDRFAGNVLFEPYRTEPVRTSVVEAAAASRTHSRIPRRPAR